MRKGGPRGREVRDEVGYTGSYRWTLCQGPGKIGKEL